MRILVMILFKLLVIIGFCNSLEWNNKILQSPPWGIDNCNFSSIQNDFKCSMTVPGACFQTCPNRENCNVTVAVILPKNNSYIVNLDEAKRVLNEFEKSEDINFNFLYFDDQCKQEFATVSEIIANTQCVHVILGPICDYCVAGVARSAKYIGNYGIPVITPGGFTFDFTNKKQQCSDEFYMTVNSGPSDYRSYAEFFHLIMDRFKWKKVALLYDKLEQNELGGENACYFVMTSIIEEIKKVNNIDYHDGDLLILGMNYSEYLQRIVGVKYGIILTCTSHKGIRKFAIEFAKLNMMKEYTVFNFQTYNNADDPSKPWLYSEDPDETNEMAKKGFKSIFTFTPFNEANFEKVQTQNRKGSIYLDGLYDGMSLYRTVLNESLNRDGNSSLKGYEITRKMMGRTFQGRNGEIIMNCNGQRVAEYALLQLNESDQYTIIGIYTNLNKTITRWTPLWDKAPRDTPECGYDNSLCETYDPFKIVLICSLLVLCLATFIVGFLLYRHLKLKAEIYSMAWKVNYDDILFFPIKSRSSFQSSSSLRRGSQLTYLQIDGLSMAGDRQLYTTVGFFKAIRVAVKKLQDVKIELNHDELLELKVIKDLSHDNLVKFHGASVDIPNCILSEYCPKGSLQDILENENVQLDATFRMSLIMDVVRGMSYLHHSEIKSHGALKSTNCLIDSRFVVKISDFGLHFLRKHSTDIDNDKESHSFWERRLWTAPEILRMENPPPGGTQKADVYSFAIIMHEIIVRQGVFYIGHFKNAKGELFNNLSLSYKFREKISEYFSFQMFKAVDLLPDHFRSREGTTKMFYSIKRLNRQRITNEICTLFTEILKIPTASTQAWNV